jgi:NADPH-dependent 2,4-dienoyl-CoA reductase/sulfur reductase-like enzyme
MKPSEAEVVVVGAGPAGLAAARAMAERGIGRILVVDRDEAPGGLPRFCRHPGFGWEYSHRLESGPAFARRQLAALDRHSVTLLMRTTALALRAGPELELLSAEHGVLRLSPRAVILATGIRERPRSARLVPGRRPERGVLTTGQLQQMVTRGVSVGGRRAVVVGTEHVAFSVLLTARHAGLEVVAMVGAEDRVMSYRPIAWMTRSLIRVPIHLSSTIADIDGDERVQSVLVSGPQGERAIACDTVIFSGEFVPDSAMLPGGPVALDRNTGGPMIDQHGRTSEAGVFAAGNLLRAVETSGFAAIEGARVGANVAAYLKSAPRWIADGPAIRLGRDLAYLVPHRWTAGSAGDAPTLPVSLRTRTDLTNAKLRLTGDGRELWLGRRTDLLRHRRIALPDAAIAAIAGATSTELALDIS